MKRDEFIKIRVTKQELRDWKAGGKACGYETFASFVRDSIRGAVLVSRNKRINK